MTRINTLEWSKNEDGEYSAGSNGFCYTLKKNGMRDEDGCWHPLINLSICFGGEPPYEEEIITDSMFSVKAAKRLAQAHADTIENVVEETWRDAQ